MLDVKLECDGCGIEKLCQSLRNLYDLRQDMLDEGWAFKGRNCFCSVCLKLWNTKRARPAAAQGGQDVESE